MHAVQPQARSRSNSIAGQPARERIELRAVADVAEELLGVAAASAPARETVPRVGCTRPVIRFISVVLPEPFGPTRLVMPGGRLSGSPG